MATMTLKVKVIDLDWHAGCMFWANLVIISQTHHNLCRKQDRFLRILSEMAKMTLKVKLNDLHFQYQVKASQDACFMEIWWFQHTFVRSYRAYDKKVKCMDRQTDRWTDTGNDNTPSAWNDNG